jgi:nucleotide-binding universal stress UspA family protein
MRPYSHILVPVDLGDQSKRVLHEAKTIADRFGSRVDLLYCFPNPQFPDTTGLLNPFSSEVIEEARKDAELQLQAMLTSEERELYQAKVTVAVADPLTAIVDYAKREGVDLIVMGTHGRTGLTHMFLGSVAERVVRTAPCPVLTVH